MTINTLRLENVVVYDLYSYETFFFVKEVIVDFDVMSAIRDREILIFGIFVDNVLLTLMSIMED